MCGTKVVCTGCLYVDCRRTTPSPVGGGLPPLFRLIHPQPLMTQAKQNKERFIYRRSARSLVFLSLFIFFPPLSLFLIFLSFLLPLPSTGPRLFRAISFVLLARINSSLRFPSLAFDTVSLSHPHPLIASVCLSILPTHPPTHLSLFLSFQARSLAHMRANEID